MPMTVAQALFPFGWLRLAGALLLMAGPGLALAMLLGPRQARDHALRAALGLAMAMAFWPLLFSWFEPLHLGLATASALVIAVLAWALAVTLWWKERRTKTQAAQAEGHSIWPRTFLWLAVIAAGVFGLWAIRDLVAGMGSDSYHHTLITTLFAEGGRIPANYEPYAPLATFRYHFGFHALAAVLTWFSGLEPRLAVPILAEVLVGLVPLTVAYLVETMGGDRRASLIAAVITAFVSPFPSLMVLYGRFPQLAGLVMLPVFMGLVWRVVRGEGEKASLPQVVQLAMLAAGLGLVHYRVTIVAAYGALVFATVGFVAAAERRAMLGRIARALVPALVGAGLLIAPWIWHVASTWKAGYPVVLGGGSLKAFYDLHRLGGYVLGQPTNWALLALLVIALGITACNRSHASLALVAWVAALLALSTPPFAKLQLDAVSAVISLCVPVACLIGLGLGAVLLGDSRGARLVCWATAACLVAATGVGALSFARTIDPRWSFVTRDDLGAMRWIAQSTPPEARFMVNTYNFPFAPRFVIGIDAGYWIPLFAGRSTVTVPMIYTSERAAQPDLADSLVALHNLGGHLTTDEAIALLRQQRVDYVYIGANGGPIAEAELASSPDYELVYSEGAAAIYRLIGPYRDRAIPSGGPDDPSPASCGAISCRQ